MIVIGAADKVALTHECAPRGSLQAATLDECSVRKSSDAAVHQERNFGQSQSYKFCIMAIRVEGREQRRADRTWYVESTIVTEVLCQMTAQFTRE